MKVKTRVYIFINGILSDPRDSDGWTDRAVTWTNTERRAKGYIGEKYEYMAHALTRRFHQQRRAEKLAKMISFYAKKSDEWDVVLVGHSNGCDIIMRVLRLIDRPVHSVHLIAAACEADMQKSGLLAMKTARHIGNLYVYIAGKDKAMKKAHLSQSLFGWAGLGYGDLGGQNPDNVKAIIGMHNVIFEPNYGHSTWFEPENFDVTMKFITSK